MNVDQEDHVPETATIARTLLAAAKCAKGELP